MFWKIEKKIMARIDMEKLKQNLKN